MQDNHQDMQYSDNKNLTWRKPPKTVWMLYDIDNGHYPHRNYCWWFPTKKLALEHKREQLQRRHGARLVGPVKFSR